MSEENPSEENHEEEQPRPRKKRKRLIRSVKTHQSSGQRKARPKQNAVPDTDACLNALGQLPGLIAMGIVTTAQANAIKGVYGTILQQHHRSRTAKDQGQLEDSDVMEILRANPSMLSMLSSLLTDEQIATVMQEVKDDEDGEA